MKKNLIVLQKGNKDCGAACLLSIIRYYGGDVSLDRLIDMTKTTKEGTNFYNLNIAASDFKLISKSFKVDDLEKLKKLETPFIAQINNKNYMHFVVIYKINNNKIIIMDPSIGKNIVDIFDFSNSWTGYIMTFEKYSNVPLYKEEKVLNRIIKNVIIKNSNIIIFLIILSIISTVITCFVGLYSQIVFDKIINTNLNNLIIITIIFSVLFIVKNITNFIHNHLFIFFNQKIDLSIMISTYSKIILLPYKFYKNKTTAEVLSRINDLSYLKNFISKIIILFFLDSLTFIVSLFIIYSVSDKILLILLLMLLVYLTIIILSNKVIREKWVVYEEKWWKS